MKTLKRKHARIALALTMITIALLALLAVLTRAEASGTLIKLTAVGFVLAMLVTSVFNGKTMTCPHCGKGKAAMRWNSGEPQLCRKCGKRIVFDDEIQAED